jgi:hypothetical protein
MRLYCSGTLITDRTKTGLYIHTNLSRFSVGHKIKERTIVLLRLCYNLGQELEVRE